MSIGNKGMEYLMPLSSSSPSNGPSKSIFSTKNSFDYSPDTHKIVKNLMEESRLTYGQRSGFQSILRNGAALPTRPSDIYRQEMCRQRHAQKASSQGLHVTSLPRKDPKFTVPQQLYIKFGSGGRRSYQNIRNSGELDPPQLLSQQKRRYIPVDKEKEKERFAHRMAFGKDPPAKVENPIHPKIRGLTPARSPQPQISLLDERFLELEGEIEERKQFLEQMRLLGAGGAYQGAIVSQIQELLSQMKNISVEKTAQSIQQLNLGVVHNCFQKDGYKFDNLLTRE